MTSVPKRRRYPDPEERPRETEEETGATWPQTEMPGAPRGWDRKGEAPSPRAFQENRGPVFII